MQELKPLHPLPSRPVNMNDAQFTQVVESKDDFQYVRKILPTLIVPEPPKHDQYPTPSGWVPIDVKKASKLPYYVLRTRFHNYPIYLTEREGGSRKLIRIRYIEGDIWVSKTTMCLVYFLFYFFLIFRNSIKIYAVLLKKWSLKMKERT